MAHLIQHLRNQTAKKERNHTLILNNHQKPTNDKEGYLRATSE